MLKAEIKYYKHNSRKNVEINREKLRRNTNYNITQRTACSKMIKCKPKKKITDLKKSQKRRMKRR